MWNGIRLRLRLRSAPCPHTGQSPSAICLAESVLMLWRCGSCASKVQRRYAITSDPSTTKVIICEKLFPPSADGVGERENLRIAQSLMSRHVRTDDAELDDSNN